jgi:hypothetical protein
MAASFSWLNEFLAYAQGPDLCDMKSAELHQMKMSSNLAALSQEPDLLEEC